HIANAVSKLHGNVSRAMWGRHAGVCPIISITNAQNWRYWADKQLYRYSEQNQDDLWNDRKKYLKKRAFEIVADQTGKLFKPSVFTMVWARRFAGYKRAELITADESCFE